MVEELKAIAPDGNLYNIPADKEADWLGRGPDYRIVTPALKPIDLAKDGKEVNVVFKNWDPSKGPGYGTIPIDKLNAPEFNDHFTLFSQAERAGQYRQKVEAAAQQIAQVESKSPTVSLDYAGDIAKLPEAKQYENADIKTADGKWKLQFEQPNGSITRFLAPADKLADYIQAGAKFQDDNYQALVDAHAKSYLPTPENPKPNAPFIAGAMNVGGIAEMAEKRTISDPSINNFSRARDIGRLAAFSTNPTLKQGVEMGEIGALPLSTLGFGEMGIAEKAGAGVAAKLGTGVGGTIVKGAVEGAIITSPRAIAQATIEKDPKAAAETLLLGAGLGAAFNLGARGLVSAGKQVLEGRLTKAADEMGVNALDKELIGTPQQQEGFFKLLGEKGVAAEGAASKTASVFDKLAKGEAFEGIASKLDSEAEKVPATSIMSKIETIGTDTIPLTKQTQQEGRTSVMELNKSIEKMADKQGNLSLSDLVKVARTAGEKMEGEEAAFFQKVNDEVLGQAIKLGNSASEKAGAKLAGEWAQASFNQKLASALPKTLEEFEKLTASQAGDKKGNKLVELIAKAVKGKVAHGISGAIGIHGGLPGMAASYVVHKGVEKGVDLLTESYLSNPKNASQLTGWLGKQLTNENLASYLALDAKAAYARKLSEIPEILTKPATKAVSNASPIKELLGPQANGLSKDKQFDKLSQQISNLAANPEVRQSHIENVVAPFSNHPELQSAMTQDMENKIQYIYSILPKNPNAPQPFARVPDWKPTPTQMKDFENQLAIAQDPLMLIEHMKNGTITPAQVATASTLNPAILQQMRGELQKLAYSGKVDLTYQQKLSASILMGENIAVELNKVPQLQSVYAPQPPPANQGQGGSNIKASAQAEPTPAQRISNK